MQIFTQKYAIIHLIEPLPNDFTFSMQDWPLHVTLADVFAVDSDISSVTNDIAKRFEGYPRIESMATNDEWFGENKDIHVMLIDKNDSLDRIHKDLINVLKKHGVRFNVPEYVGEGYKPHSTIQGNARLYTGDGVVFDSLTIVDMFPKNDPYMRRIVTTIHL